MKIRIKKISPLSLAATLALVYALVSIGAVLLAVIVGSLGLNISIGDQIHVSGTGPIILLGVFPAMFVLPITSGISGAISGIVIAWIYNFSTRFFDGLMIETEETKSWEQA